MLPNTVVRAIKKALPGRRLSSTSEERVSAPETTQEEKLIYATTEAQDTLLAASTVFPFVLFKDTIQLDREKLTIIHRSFFRTSDTISVQIGDILSVKSNVGPFFGNITLSTKYFTNSIQNVSFLRRSDVIKFQRLIQGRLIAHERQIDCSDVESAQLVTLLSDLGEGATS
jgi:hypothetical protein